MLPEPQKRRSPHGAGHEAKRLGGRINYAALTGSRPVVQTGAPIDTLLVRLEGVQRAGKGWRALCPSCGGKSHKLAIAEGDNGAVMMTCFSCHDTPAILAAIGLTRADLFPERIRDESPAGRRAARQAFKESAWGAAIGVLAFEATVIEVACTMVRAGEALGDVGMDRVHVAARRIHDAQEVLQ
jgi:hypothetical protein